MERAIENYPLVELGPITDLFAENIDRIEVFGEHARIVFWRWRQVESSRWERIALEWAIIRPLRTFHLPLERCTHIPIVRPPIFLTAGMH